MSPAMMWRNSGSVSSTLVSRTRPNSLHSPLASPYRGHPSGGGGGGGGGGILYVLFAPSSSSHLHSSSSGIPSPFDSLKLGLTKPLQSRPFILSSCSSSAAAAALSPSSSISKAARDAADALQHYSRCYWELSKARLSLLVVATSGTGFVLGSGGVIDFAGLCFTCAGTMMVAASANSLNQVFEINNDAKMKRTMQRPLPSGQISVPHAITWASSVGVAGTTLLAWKANALTAGLAASTLTLYAFIYTPLKQIHPINTWVGAVVGAIPPLLGNCIALRDMGGIIVERQGYKRIHCRPGQAQSQKKICFNWQLSGHCYRHHCSYLHPQLPHDDTTSQSHPPKKQCHRLWLV